MVSYKKVLKDKMELFDLQEKLCPLFKTLSRDEIIKSVWIIVKKCFFVTISQ